MEAITDTAIFDAQDYRPEDQKAALPIDFNADAMATVAAAVGITGTPFVKLRLKGIRDYRPLAYTERLENGYRICISVPEGLSVAQLTTLLNVLLSVELGLIAGQAAPQVTPQITTALPIFVPGE